MSTLSDVTHRVGVREAGEAAVDGTGAKRAFFFLWQWEEPLELEKLYHINSVAAS